MTSLLMCAGDCSHADSRGKTHACTRTYIRWTLEAAAVALSLVLCAGLAYGALVQSPHTKKKKSHKPKAAPCRSGCKPASTESEASGSSSEEDPKQRELTTLARALHTAAPGAYERLAAFATKNAGNVWGARAALALGYEDYSKNHGAQALAWMGKSKGDALLREYGLYWSAQTKRALKRPAEAYSDLQAMLRDYPNTAMKEQLLEVFAPTATETGHAQEAIDALVAYTATNSKPALLLERAQAYRLSHQLPRAAKDYQILFYKHPLSDEAKAAGSALSLIARELGKEYPYPGAEMQEQRAQIFFDAHKWKEARSEYEKLLAMLRDEANPGRQRAELRVAQCRVQLKGSGNLVAALQLGDPDVDAERLYVLSQAERSAKNEAGMLAALEQLGRKYPESKWYEEGLMAAGNYYWVGLDRVRAASYYQQVVNAFPGGKNAYNAEWRTAWVAYLRRDKDADSRLTAFLLKYPVSADAVDALYWLGRNAERGGNPAHARGYYNKAVDRFPETYFAHAAKSRLVALGPGEENPAEFLAKIPPPPPLRAFDEILSSSAGERWARAQALRSIGFDASAELEWKAGYFATSSPRFLLAAAQAAFDQGHFGAGMAYGRMMIPSFDSRKIDDLPVSAWKVLYPLPYEAALRREAARNNFDPMLAAGLIRQESTFQAEAVSHKDAVGLMQVLPKTGKRLAKQLKIRYTKNKLFEPDYNLQLGMLYIAGLLRDNGEPEYALAAFNAGEERIASWRAERHYEEVAELVESIPFTETREYVQIVLRNAAVYRMIYGPGGSPSPVSAGSSSVSRSR